MRGSSVANKRSTKPASVRVSKKLGASQRSHKAKTSNANKATTAKRLTKFGR